MKRTIMSLVLVLLFGLFSGCFVRSAAEFTPVGPYYASSGYYSYYRWHPSRHYHYRSYRHYYEKRYRHHDGYDKRSHRATVRKMKEKEKQRLATVKKSSGGKKKGDHASTKRTGRTSRGHKRSR